MTDADIEGFQTIPLAVPSLKPLHDRFHVSRPFQLLLYDRIHGSLHIRRIDIMERTPCPVGINISAAGIRSIHFFLLPGISSGVTHILPAVSADDLPLEAVLQAFPVLRVRRILLMNDLSVLIKNILHLIKQLLADNRLMHPFQDTPFLFRCPVSPDAHVQSLRNLPVNKRARINRIGEDIDQRPSSPHGMLIFLSVPDAKLDLPPGRRHRAHFIQPSRHFRMAHSLSLPLKQHPDVWSNLLIHIIAELSFL